MKQLRTPAQARAWLDFQGISIAQWAREHQVHHSLVREILAGRKKCLRGMSHNIAVLLGMKAGVITTRPGRVRPAGAPGEAAQQGVAA
ncbi:gp16 family phage-associated protein [Inhella inkyongensis]|uniref:Gp16 family phage-associated protein n=1 Tax=Inhella inkyongensis TaxID=392593 RepID=A0A840S5Z1_9BURK|nr:DNA-binding protein [Inhella inkyongensis]MBB5204426.1 gp16 family phage-associated protein [Inhella inkyongensis]